MSDKIDIDLHERFGCTNGDVGMHTSLNLRRMLQYATCYMYTSHQEQALNSTVRNFPVVRNLVAGTNANASVRFP